MKKIVSLVLVMLMVLSVMAVASADLEVTKKTLIELPASKTAYFYAKVENTGSAPMKVGNGKLVGFSADDDILVTDEYVSSCPSSIILAPGEYTYMYNSCYDAALEADDIAEYKFKVSEGSYAYEYAKYPCEVTFEVGDKYNSNLYVTFTNDTDAPIVEPYLVGVLFDEAGEIIGMDYKTCYDIVVHPGSTITVSLSLYSDLVEFYTTNGVKPASADAMVMTKIG